MPFSELTDVSPQFLHLRLLQSAVSLKQLEGAFSPRHVINGKIEERLMRSDLLSLQCDEDTLGNLNQLLTDAASRGKEKQTERK